MGTEVTRDGRDAPGPSLGRTSPGPSGAEAAARSTVRPAVAAGGLLLALTVLAGCGDGAPLTGPSPGSEGPDEPAARATARLVDLGGLGGASTVAVDVNASLQVAGTAETAGGHERAFLWEEGDMRDLGTLGGSWSTAADVNDWGQVAGTSVTDAGEARAFFWAAGEMYEIGTLGGRESYGVAVNDAGEVAGYSTTADGEIHAFLWSRGRLHDLGTLGGSGSFTAAANDRGDVVGRSATGDGANHAFRWSGGEIAGIFPERARSSTAVDVSEAGHVLVNTRIDGRGRARVWRDGAVTALGSGTGASVVAADVDADGRTVGQISGSSGGTRATLWRADGEPEPLCPAGFARSGTASGINDAGQVTGSIRPEGSVAHRAFRWSEGRMRILEPSLFDDPPESTAGITIAPDGAVVGLATQTSGAIRSFVWIPADRPARGAVPASDSGAADTEPGGTVDRPAARVGAEAPMASGSPLGRAVERLSSERPELAWPRALEALRQE